MLKLKQIRLVNFGGYKDTLFNFEADYPFGAIKPLALFFGPNGIGKSTVMEAIRLVSNPLIFKEREQSPEVYLRQYIRDDDYNPVSDAVLDKAKNEMRIEAIFTDAISHRNVVLTNKGFEVNELEEVHRGHAFSVDADHPNNWNKFQLADDEAKLFLKLAEAVFGFDCDLDGEVTDTITNPNNGEQLTKTYFNDFIIEKGGETSLSDQIKSLMTLDRLKDQREWPAYQMIEGELGLDIPNSKPEKKKRTKVHFSRMSAGEKKLATILRLLVNPENTATRDIILIDNLEMHVYYKRHALMIDKLLEYFPDKQIIATTHSGVMIQHVPPRQRYDLEVYRPEYKMNEENTQKVAAEIREETTIDPNFAKVVDNTQDSLQELCRDEPNVGVRFPKVDTSNIGTVDYEGWTIHAPKRYDLEEYVWNCEGKQVRKIDRIMQNAIRFELSEDKVHYEAQFSPILPSPTPPKIKAAAEAKREAERSRTRQEVVNSVLTREIGINLKPVGFLSRLKNALKAARKVWSLSKR